MSDETTDADRLRFAILKETSKYQTFWTEAFEPFRAHCAAGGDPKGDAELLLRFTLGSWGLGIIIDPSRVNDTLAALDPRSEIPDQLPFEFDECNPPIVQLSKPQEARYGERPGRPLKPSERIIKVDLSARPSDLLFEFKNFLARVDKARSLGGLPSQYSENYSRWEPDNSRFRKEAWRQLKVWQMRKEKKTFSEIAKVLKMSADAARKAFYKAYGLIEGRNYDREKFLRAAGLIQKSELAITCENCPQRRTCTSLCPEALRFVDQDQKKLRELIFADPEKTAHF